jgi:hypothetical protein
MSGGAPIPANYASATNMTRLVPALRLIAEAGVIKSYLVRWSSDRSPQQISDLILQDLVSRQLYRVACTLGFEEIVDLGIGEGCVTPEIPQTVT